MEGTRGSRNFSNCTIERYNYLFSSTTKNKIDKFFE